jgi:serine protease inhibitor ecotin
MMCLIITRMNRCRLGGTLGNQDVRKIGFINFQVDRVSFEGKIVAKCPEP